MEILQQKGRNNRKLWSRDCWISFESPWGRNELNYRETHSRWRGKKIILWATGGKNCGKVLLSPQPAGKCSLNGCKTQKHPHLGGFLQCWSKWIISNPKKKSYYGRSLKMKKKKRLSLNTTFLKQKKKSEWLRLGLKKGIFHINDKQYNFWKMKPHGRSLGRSFIQDLSCNHLEWTCSNLLIYILTFKCLNCFSV